ncbi:MAG TPA: extracellular solute-binding protein [Caldilineaceae bacterium]|nr:extracellular solute-binding protein [Caldilineaceae bacterium]
MTDKERNVLNSPLSRRQALKLMGAFTGMAALSACVAPAAPGTTGAAPEAGAGEAAAPAGEMPHMVVAHRREYFAEMEELFANAVRDWAAANNVDVETTTVAAEANQDFVPKLLAEVAAGNPPSLVYHVRLTQLLYSQNALEPVTNVVEQTTELYGEPPYGQTSVNIIDGEWYGIPYMMHGGGQFARRSVFEEHSIDPLTLATYDERREACLTVSDPEANMYGWGLTVNSGGDATGLIESIIQNWGGHYTDEEITEVTFNSPETVAAVTWLSEIYTDPRFAPMVPPGVMSWTDSSNNEAFLAGTIAYTHNAASVYAKAKADGNPIFEDTVVLETAIGPLGVKLESGGGGQFIIPRGAAHRELAEQLAMHMLEPEVFLPISLISAGLFLPAYAGYYEMEEVIEAFQADPNLQRMGEAAQGNHPGSSWPALPSPLFDAIAAQAVLTDMMAQIIAQGVTPEEAVAQAHDRIISIGQEMGFFV